MYLLLLTSTNSDSLIIEASNSFPGREIGFIHNVSKGGKNLTYLISVSSNKNSNIHLER